ncbi:MAG: hypothetical protein KAI17_02205 [Thiotrichaceae bacterium]|nr:hypothetical protein [Thiotrichaceae bacterium]
MITAKKISGVALAAAAATMFALAPMSATAGSHKSVKCTGINSCKGTSACATATTSCAGQNSCKGQGWVKATKAECSEKGGKVQS